MTSINVLDTSAAKAIGTCNIDNMDEEFAKWLLLNKFWTDECINPMRLFTDRDILVKTTNQLFFNADEKKWHLWSVPRQNYGNPFEPGFVKPDFIFIDNNQTLYVVKLKCCWYRRSEGVYTYCIDQGSPIDENVEILRYRDMLGGYDLIGCQNFYACKKRAQYQVETNRAVLKNIIVNNQALSNQFGNVIGLTMVCVYDADTKSIMGFV